MNLFCEGLWIGPLGTHTYTVYTKGMVSRKQLLCACVFTWANVSSSSSEESVSHVSMLVSRHSVALSNEYCTNTQHIDVSHYI